MIDMIIIFKSLEKSGSQSFTNVHSSPRPWCASKRIWTYL